MTRKEAKEILTHNWTRVDNPNYSESELDEAFFMAIEALSEPSRQDAIEAIQNAYCKPCKERGDDHNEVRCRACDYDNAIIQIDALPSAEAVDVYKAHEEEHLNIINRIKELQYAIAKTQTIVKKILEDKGGEEE